MANRFVHTELNTGDVAAAKTFYGGLFDWNIRDVDMGPMGTYTLLSSGEDGIGGITQQQPGKPPLWIPYISVDDVTAATEKARSLGGTVVQERAEVPQMGWFSIIVDPTGATFALWQAASA